MIQTSAGAAALLGGVLLWFAVHFAGRAFRVQKIEHAPRRRRGDEARLPASEGLAEASQGSVREHQAEDPLPARAEETGAKICATLCDVTGRTGVDVSAGLSRDEDGDECFVLLRGEGDVILNLKVRLLEFVRDDDALVVWFTANRTRTSREHPIWTLWPHDPKAHARLLAGLEAVPDCCCVAVDACSVQSASRCRRMAARANGCVY